MMSGTTVVCVQTTFQTVDNDRSGFLDQSELQRALGLLGVFHDVFSCLCDCFMTCFHVSVF